MSVLHTTQYLYYIVHTKQDIQIYTMSKDDSPHIAFLHPDLGIGGAEQLVVNLCIASLRQGYTPHIYTPTHHASFPQTHDGSICVHEHGSFFGLLPQSIFTRFKGLLVYLRMLVCTLWMLCYAQHDFSAVVVDQVSTVLPLLRLFGYNTIFYCHYPDQLLAGNRTNPLKKVYRFVLDTLEELSIAFAHKVYVNSQYTKEVFYQQFSLLRWKKVEVMYPSIDLQQFDREVVEEAETEAVKKEINGEFICSLNRYERKKGINLAIQAYSDLLTQHPEVRVKLVIAGGYDAKIGENVEHLNELRELAEKLKIKQKVLFYTSVSNNTRLYLLKTAKCVVYTPINEHFGIVPVEAMYLGTPIIAHCSGGPKESVGEGCGALCTERREWSQAMWRLLAEKKNQIGRKRVIEKFGFQYFSKQFRKGIKQVSGV